MKTTRRSFLKGLTLSLPTLAIPNLVFGENRKPALVDRNVAFFEVTYNYEPFNNSLVGHTVFSFHENNTFIPKSLRGQVVSLPTPKRVFDRGIFKFPMKLVAECSDAYEINSNGMERLKHRSSVGIDLTKVRPMTEKEKDFFFYRPRIKHFAEDMPTEYKEV